ncbi:GGDEF domain-containing protein [Uliginosibacterium sp. TH139]|uniref:GGDEF domain-containing protein n=1 Tax=Uliginosibacterium sp. TH139 TaxID=2067453 RepID=UPI001C1F94BE|nr:diguanylate cyclase [Uliginosibacterium sp. TH139]
MHFRLSAMADEAMLVSTARYPFLVMNLKPRFLLLTVLLFIVAAIPSWLTVRAMAENIFEMWAQRYTEKQVLYDRSRTLQPILREVALSRQMADSPALLEWARDPDSPRKKARALDEMERFRQNFTDHSYFVGLTRNGHYFHNNAANAFSGHEYRYTLKRGETKDAWFFDLIRQGRDLHINVNPDPELGITKLWVDVLMRDGGEILGIAGTGLDLTSFIRDVVEVGGEGVTTLFVDHDGAIQLHRNQSFIDFSSISRHGAANKSLDLLFDRQLDRQAVFAAMKELESMHKSVVTTFVNIHGKRQLVGVSYVPEVDWYEITLLDLDVLLPLGGFAGIFVAYVLTLLGVLLLFNLALGHFVLKPLSQLDHAMSEIESGKPSAAGSVQVEHAGAGEIRGLLERFNRMARSVIESRLDLEARIQERTMALERLTKIDPLTELLNRRGMTERIEARLARAAREHGRIGILWLDIDYFKEINDRHGHAVGDQVLKAVSDTICSVLRPYDVAARWGGDEFLVLLDVADAEVLDHLGERLRAAVQAHPQPSGAEGAQVAISVSVGGHLALADEALDDILLHGDQALYAAKAAGRNCYRASRDPAGA